MRREDFARGLAVLGAGLGWAALALPFVLITRQIGAPALAAWRFVGFFTILSNLLVAAVLTRAALHRPCSPRLELGCATAIVMVGLVYILLLRATWNPLGAQKLADMALHAVAPVLYLAYFLARLRPALSLLDARAALAFPLGYVASARARGGGRVLCLLVPRSEPASRSPPPFSSPPWGCAGFPTRSTRGLSAQMRFPVPGNPSSLGATRQRDDYGRIPSRRFRVFRLFRRRRRVFCRLRRDLP